jgi:hypothetical protein
MGQVILTLSVVHIFVSFGSNGKQEGEDEEQTSEQEELNPLKKIWTPNYTATKIPFMC